MSRKLDDERNKYTTLQERLRMFQSGTLKIDDHFKNLVNVVNRADNGSAPGDADTSQGVGPSKN